MNHPATAHRHGADTPVLIRSACLFDVPAIVSMARTFYAATEFRHFAPFDAESVGTLAAALIDSGIVLVADAGSHLCGVIALAVAPFMFNRDLRAAHEVIRWADADACPFDELQRAATTAAVESGCVAVQWDSAESSGYRDLR